MKIITAFTNRSFGIGYNNKLPWDIPEDMTRFKNLTRNNTVVMGRMTWQSIGCRPLRDRFNIVVTSDDKFIEDDDVQNLAFISGSTLDDISKVINQGEIFIIGGEELYRKYVGEADTIYATIIEQDFECDRFFPVERLSEYRIDHVSPRMYSVGGNCNYRFVTYKKLERLHDEFSYLNMMSDILYKGEARPDRTGIGTLALFGHQLRFDISTSVPFLTTKLLAWRTVIKELLWFLSGSTDTNILAAQGVSIWVPNTSRKFLDERGLKHYREGDMGPLYSHALRHFGATYKGCDENYSGYDQFTELIRGLKSDPYSRRHVMTTFDPSVVDQCVLMPCHGIAIQFFVSGEKPGRLSCHVYCRSSDSFLGLPFNIASYAVLTYIVAKLCEFVPWHLIVSTGDTHIYSNHVDQVKAQLTRNPLPFPKLVVSDAILNKDISDVTIDDFTLDGYVSYGYIKAPMAV